MIASDIGTPDSQTSPAAVAGKKRPREEIGEENSPDHDASSTAVRENTAVLSQSQHPVSLLSKPDTSDTPLTSAASPSTRTLSAQPAPPTESLAAGVSSEDSAAKKRRKKRVKGGE